MTSASARCFQCSLRPLSREAGGGGAGGVALHPPGHVVTVELLAPEQAGIRPPCDVPVALAQRGVDDVAVELVGLGPAAVHDGVEVLAEPVDARVGRREPQVDRDGLAGRDGVEAVPERALGAVALGVDRLGAAVDDALVDGVLGIHRLVGERLLAEEVLGVGLVVAEERRRRARGGEHVAPEEAVGHLRGPEAARRPAVATDLVQLGDPVVEAPRPRVAQPDRRQDVQRGGLGPVVGRRDADADVVRTRLGVGHHDVEELVPVEDAGVAELELPFVTGALAVLTAQLLIGELRLRVAVEPLHPRVRRRAVDGPPVLLGVLAVVALLVGEAEEALLEDGVLAVPEGDRDVEEAEAVADAAEPVLTPAVGPRHGVVEGELRPRVALRRVVLAYGAPLPPRQVGAPESPRGVGARRLDQPGVLGAQRLAGWQGAVHGHMVLHRCVEAVTGLDPRRLDEGHGGWTRPAAGITRREHPSGAGRMGRSFGR